MKASFEFDLPDEDQQYYCYAVAPQLVDSIVAYKETLRRLSALHPDDITYDTCLKLFDDYLKLSNVDLKRIETEGG